jgi:hypothetical protein
MIMPIDAFRWVIVRVGEPRARSAVTLSVEEPCDVNSTFGRRKVVRDATQPYNHGGTIAVAYAWLAFYAIVAIHHVIVSIVGALAK